MANNSLNYVSNTGLGLKKAKVINADRVENHAEELSAITLRENRDYVEDDFPGSFDGPTSEGGCPSGWVCINGVCVKEVPYDPVSLRS